MRTHALILCLCSTSAFAAGSPTLVSGPTPLPAEPAALSVGSAGPFNRLAFDFHATGPHDPVPRIVCLYAEGFRYRCDALVEAPAAVSGRRRITVVVPDLGRGSSVRVLFSSPRGAHEATVEVANPAQVMREIEVLPLSAAGSARPPATGPTGTAPQLLTLRATTSPAIATASLDVASACERIVAEWVRVSATDPVFASPAGPLKGSLVLDRAVVPGSPVGPDNLPSWRVTYPHTATRLQFIAHYQVKYRVDVCPQRVITDPGNTRTGS